MTDHVTVEKEAVQPGESVVVDIEGREIGVFNVDGEYYALPNTCPHQGGPLCEGPVDGTVVADEKSGFKPRWDHDDSVVSCPWHNLSYHIPTGRCLGLDELHLPSYPVAVEADELIVEF